MRYCARCVYPENAKPAIIFDEQGVCSGCRLVESRERIDWQERERWLRELLEEYKTDARERGNIYDCIIPVSGGKDSHFQTYLMKEVYGMNPLLVTFNHGFNTRLGIQNLANMVKQFNCDLLRITVPPDSARRIARYMVRKVGDLTWHYHAGIRTFPIQIAVKYRIPLMIWGEEGRSELVGMFNQDDMIEYTKWVRHEHDMRGYEPEDLINEESGITPRDIAPYVYPPDEEVEALGMRGIHISNYVRWNAKKHAELMIQRYGFATAVPGALQRERTFNLYDKLEDHANPVHDYMKYLKFGYGRATDDASTEIRQGRMTREEGIELVTRYDPVRPRTLDTYLEFLEMTEQEFMDAIEPMRDREIWDTDGETWFTTDSVANHVNDPGVDEARRPLDGEVSKEFLAGANAGNVRTYVENEEEIVLL